MSTSNRVLLVINLLVGAVLLGSASSQSVSAVESNSVISACVNKSSGALRISSKCTKTERPLTWNQTGIQGPTGPQGPAGPKGTDASIKTKLITIKYIGNGTSLLGCGDGSVGLATGTATTYTNWQYGSVFLTNRYNWQSNPYCSLTIRVIE